jgi:hypothetical protein
MLLPLSTRLLPLEPEPSIRSSIIVVIPTSLWRKYRYTPLFENHSKYYYKYDLLYNTLSIAPNRFLIGIPPILLYEYSRFAIICFFFFFYLFIYCYFFFLSRPPLVDYYLDVLILIFNICT